METEEAVVLLGAAPATAYREFLYRPHGRLASWINDRFEVLAAPGRRADRAVREGDLLIEVALGQHGGRCVALTDDRLDEPFLAHVFAPGRLLLRPRQPTELTEPLAVEPVVERPAPGSDDPWMPAAFPERPVNEHYFVEASDAGTGTPLAVDTEAAVSPFDPAERARVADPLLPARVSATAVAWTRRMHPGVSGVTVEEIRSALSGYVDPAAVQAALERRNRREPSASVDASGPDTDAVLVECVHQFQIKCYCDPGEHDGRAGETTLDSLGLVVRTGSGFRGADRGNATAQKRLLALAMDPRNASRLPTGFSPASWFDAMTDPSVFGWRTKAGTGLHVLLVRRLRQAERHLLTLPAYRGMTPASLGAALGLDERHGGARPSQDISTSVHTFGLAIDLAHRTNPWVRDAASWRALQRAALLLSGTRLPQGSAPEYFSQLALDPARSTGQIWDELRRRSDELSAYLRLAEDATKLRAALLAGRARSTPGLIAPEESLDQAAAAWQTRIEQDRDSLAHGDFRNHVPPAEGFLGLPRDLVAALRDHACLAWGAVDLGPGARGSGDMMHFDARIGGIGELLSQGVNFVPLTGHPCLAARQNAADAEAAAENTAEASECLGGRLWTYVSATTALPVAVFCPQTALSPPEVDVLVFAHGSLSGCPRPGQVPAGFVTDPPFALGPIVHASARPLILAVPLLDWAHPGGDRVFGRGHEHRHVLGHPELLNQFVEEVLHEVGRMRDTAAPNLTSLFLAGHSRAYDVLEPLAASRHHPAMVRGPLARLSGVWAFDTTYAGRVENWVDWLTDNPELSLHVFYRPGSRTAPVGDAFLKRQQPRLTVTQVGEQHCAVPAVRLPALLGPAAPAPPSEETAPSLDELTDRVVRSIGIWETNRGGNDPLPRESVLRTVAGVPASMATVEQATMPYAITVLRRHKALRDIARPPLTLKDLNAADARCAAVVTLLAAVADAWTHATAPAAFLSAHHAAVTATGLSDDDVRTMFRAETLRATLHQARSDSQAAGPTALNAAVAAIPVADRLGLDERSLRQYALAPSKWGENRAAWQRRAVGLMADDVGDRIEAVAVSDRGRALAVPTIRSRIAARLAKTPAPTTEELVRAVAQQNNPNDSEYGLNVWKTYQRLYGP